MSSTALVVGGGFAGLEAAIQLRKAGLEVMLVSDRPYLWIYPTSIWVVTGERGSRSRASTSPTWPGATSSRSVRARSSRSPGPVAR
jgi:NADPH-dependent 2,4-dienoyl-CoA reductase/sulfur reductase-like enzyme